LHIDLKLQFEMSGIPKRHMKWDADTLPDDTYHLPVLKRWSSKDIELVESGKGLYLHGSVGTGKTTALSALAISYIVHKSIADIRTGEHTEQLVQFINVPDLLDLIKRGFDNPTISDEANALLERLKHVPLVIFDDIGAERPSEWSRERLLTLINYRYDNEMCTFFSSNLTIPELVEQLGPRLQSRINGSCAPLAFNGPDRRKLF
jgi:DNA replication protein DnaC